VMGVGALADLLTKHWAFGAVRSPLPADQVAVIDGFFYITRTTNPGAMWSLLQEWSAQVWVLIRGSVFLVLFLVYLRQRPRALWVRLGFALVLAGALGNLYDNAFAQEGYVRDWLKFVFWGWTFPIFNLADTFICVGAPLLLIHFYRSEAGASRPQDKRA